MMMRALTELVRKLTAREALSALFLFALVAVVFLFLRAAPRDVEGQQQRPEPTNAAIFEEVIRVQEQVKALDNRVGRIERTIDQER